MRPLPLELVATELDIDDRAGRLDVERKTNAKAVVVLAGSGVFQEVPAVAVRRDAAGHVAILRPQDDGGGVALGIGQVDALPLGGQLEIGVQAVFEAIGHLFAARAIDHQIAVLGDLGGIRKGPAGQIVGIVAQIPPRQGYLGVFGVVQLHPVIVPAVDKGGAAGQGFIDDHVRLRAAHRQAQQRQRREKPLFQGFHLTFLFCVPSDYTPAKGGEATRCKKVYVWAAFSRPARPIPRTGRLFFPATAAAPPAIRPAARNRRRFAPSGC